MSPAPRKAVGGLLIIAALAFYAFLVASASGHIGRLPVLAQMLVYLVAGVAWVPLLMPLVRFIETGRFTRARR